MIEIYAEHVSGLFKTKSVDITLRTSPELTEQTVSNFVAYQLTDTGQVVLSWSEPPGVSSNRAKQIFGYELRYWIKDELDKVNVVLIKGPATNFTLRNSNPDVLVTTIYMFQIRGQSSLGWGSFSSSIEGVRVSSLIFRGYSTLPYYSSSFMPEVTLDQFLAYNKPYRTSMPAVSRTENLTPIAVAIGIAVFFAFFSLVLLIFATRFGCLGCLSKKPTITNSDCDSLDIAKRNAQIAYNQLGVCSAGTVSSSGGSSPIWPPLNLPKTYIDPHTYEDPTKVVSLFARELSPSQIIIESVIGGGEFGDVCKGTLKLASWSDVTVAIKTLKGGATEQNRCDFLTEASIMAQFNDPNVIRLEGVVTQSHPLMIVTEYMENGSLDTFLRLNESKLKQSQMVKMLKDVASGMCYLSEMNYIHRDLAARNILVNKELVCKVADFGLSREIDHEALEYTTKGGKIPIRWTAPEACNFRKYSCASDVWSFGVLMWEVLSFGERPYWNWENTDVIKAIKELYRLPPPYNCSDGLYKLMLRCWQDERNQRPKFSEIVSILNEVLQKPEELRKLTKIRELLPIDPRAPTQIQLTTTKQFLTRLQLDTYVENFERVGLGNLSNLFQLEQRDLSCSLLIHSQYDQKKILDELSRISEAYYQSLATQNSYMFSEDFLNNTVTLSQANQTTRNSIFQLIRNNSSNNSSNNSNDLLIFPNGSIPCVTQGPTGRLSQGFLV